MRPWIVTARVSVMGLLVLALGCGKSIHSTDHAEVTGKVTYNGQPVTGGSISFVSQEEGAFANNGRIDESGNYKINSPVGPVKITIDNRVLRTGIREQAMKGAGPRPGQPDPDPIKGVYVEIPQKYYQVDTTDMTYTVKAGAQTFDIELKD
jgi:hypothetical protein